MGQSGTSYGADEAIRPSLAASAAASGPDAEVAEEVLILKAARAQEEAMRLADQGRFDEAKERLTGAAAELRTAAPGSAKAAELLDQAERMDVVAPMMAAPSYTAAMRKQMFYEQRLRKQRRSR